MEGGAEARIIDVGSAEHLSMPSVGCCGSFAQLGRRRLEIVTISQKPDEICRRQ